MVGLAEGGPRVGEDASEAVELFGMLNPLLAVHDCS